MITDAQISFIAYHMIQNGIKGDVDSFKRLKENVPKYTAIDIIGDFKAGRIEAAIKQLEYLNAI